MQVILARGVAATDRTFLEMPLEDIATAKGVMANVAGVGTIAGVCNVVSINM